MVYRTDNDVHGSTQITYASLRGCCKTAMGRDGEIVVEGRAGRLVAFWDSCEQLVKPGNDATPAERAQIARFAFTT
jgi:hypothetical protein